jgi:hypothetical protein
MTLLHPARIGSPVSVWFAGGAPDRIVHEAERFRVISPAERTLQGWRFAAIAEDGGIHGFEIEGEDPHWILRRIVD